MGRRPHHPKRGALAFTPRVRAPRPIAHVRAWPAEARLGLQGFVGYKAGMTHVFTIDDRKGSPTAGQEICVPGTVVDTPPLTICAVRLYGSTPRGFNTLGEVLAGELPEDLSRKLNLPKKYDVQKAISGAEALVKEGKAEEVRVLACTQPKLAGVPKKRPELAELRVSGPSVTERWEYSKGLLGKQVRVGEVFKEGCFLDVIAITKGKGFAGPVKRWGIKILPRKQDDVKRKPGALGPWKPARVMWTVPQAGQMGYHQRAEYNKRVMKLGAKGEEVTPRGGFPRYGILRGDFVLLAGSVPGPVKRLIHLRQPMRSPKAPPSPPIITRIGTQGD